jgi:hypothetical protein
MSGHSTETEIHLAPLAATATTPAPRPSHATVACPGAGIVHLCAIFAT